MPQQKSFIFATVQMTGTRFFLDVFFNAGFEIRKAHGLRIRSHTKHKNTCYWTHTQDRYSDLPSYLKGNSFPLVVTQREDFRVNASWDAYDLHNDKKVIGDSLANQRANEALILPFAAAIVSVDAPDRNQMLADLGLLVNATFTTNWDPITQAEGPP